MGHYDEFYDEEDRKRLEEYNRTCAARNIEQKDTLCSIIDSLDYDDTDFAQELLTNLDSYKGFFKILDRSRK